MFQYMEEFAELLLPVTDVRHQVVERVVQHLAQRNKDIPEVSNVSWSVHVVQSPTVNAFVLPVSGTMTFQAPQFLTQSKCYICFNCIHFCVEWRSFHVYWNAGVCGRCPPTYHHPGTRDGSRFIGTFCKYTQTAGPSSQLHFCVIYCDPRADRESRYFNIQGQHLHRNLNG